MKHRHSIVRLLLVAVVALTTFGSAIPSPATAAPAVPRVNWSPCYRETGLPYECAVVPVPLDYSNPGAAAIQLAVTRLPATDPASRIGSLFLNPGGPGGSGVDFVLGIGPYLYTPEVRAKFDLVGFDPRGIARSTALKCFGNEKKAEAGVVPFAAYPITSEEMEAWEAAQRQEVAECEQRAGRIIDHMTTADVARDLDLLRQAVGDEQLTYAGFSYGSYLGVTYANLFPANVRAMVVDGVLDPIAWATGELGQGSTVPLFNREKSAAGAEATLDEFFRLCDSGVGCALAPNSRERFEAVLAKVKESPIPIQLPDGTFFYLTYQYFIYVTFDVMYQSAAWPEFAMLLASLDGQAAPAALGGQLSSVWQEVGLLPKRGQLKYLSPEAQAGVMCSDSDNPASYEDWRNTAVSDALEYPHFGALLTWVSSICAPWQPAPSPSRYAGPFKAQTANPVLVVGNTFDPITRYEGAVRVSELLPNSALLTLHGWGHASLFLSQSLDAAIADYLVRGDIPPVGERLFEQDVVPFAGQPYAAAAASRQSSNRSLRAEWLGGILPVTDPPSAR